jgi:rubrerythrin
VRIFNRARKMNRFATGRAFNMKTKAANWTALENQDDRKVAHLAAIAWADTMNGGARAMAIARKCTAWNAAEVVADVYSRSTGKHSQQYEAWECPECGTVHLGFESAADCCAFEAEDLHAEISE